MLNETSFNRFSAHAKNHECGIVTAFRTNVHPNKRKKYRINQSRNDDLLRDILSVRVDGKKAYGVSKVRGEYPEGDSEIPTKENSYLVVNLLDLPDFKENLKVWARKYDQDTVYYIPKGGKGRYIWTSPTEDPENYGYETPEARGRLIGREHTAKSFGKTYVRHNPFSDDIPWEFNKDMNESKKYKYDFNKVYESYFSRYTAGMFGPGDVVEFDKGLLSDPMFKNLAPDIQSAVQSMVEASIAGDAIVAVTKTNIDPRLQDNYEAATITIAYSQGGGMYYGQVTIPGSLGKYMKRTTDVYSVIPKRAIKVHDGGVRQPVDMEKVKQAFKSGKVEDVRTAKS